MPYGKHMFWALIRSIARPSVFHCFLLTTTSLCWCFLLLSPAHCFFIHQLSSVQTKMVKDTANPKRSAGPSRLADTGASSVGAKPGPKDSKKNKKPQLSVEADEIEAERPKTRRGQGKGKAKQPQVEETDEEDEAMGNVVRSSYWPCFDSLTTVWVRV